MAIGEQRMKANSSGSCDRCACGSAITIQAGGDFDGESTDPSLACLYIECHLIPCSLDADELEGDMASRVPRSDASIRPRLRESPVHRRRKIEQCLHHAHLLVQ